VAASLKQRIVDANNAADRDPELIARLIPAVLGGGIKFQGVPVLYTYAEAAAMFQRCDPRIDAARFEELCQIVDRHLTSTNGYVAPPSRYVF
jgi:hypothetical protein